jgi:hypothetical protein
MHINHPGIGVCTPADHDIFRPSTWTTTTTTPTARWRCVHLTADGHWQRRTWTGTLTWIMCALPHRQQQQPSWQPPSWQQHGCSTYTILYNMPWDADDTELELPAGARNITVAGSRPADINTPDTAADTATDTPHPPTVTLPAHPALGTTITITADVELSATTRLGCGDVALITEPVHIGPLTVTAITAGQRTIREHHNGPLIITELPLQRRRNRPNPGASIIVDGGSTDDDLRTLTAELVTTVVEGFDAADLTVNGHRCPLTATERNSTFCQRHIDALLPTNNTPITVTVTWPAQQRTARIVVGDLASTPDHLTVATADQLTNRRTVIGQIAAAAGGQHQPRSLAGVAHTP